MISRRDFMQVSMAASAMLGTSGFGNWARLAAQQALTQDQLLEFDTFGNVTISANHRSISASAVIVARSRM